MMVTKQFKKKTSRFIKKIDFNFTTSKDAKFETAHWPPSRIVITTSQRSQERLRKPYSCVPNICPHLRSGLRFRIELGPNSPNLIGSQLQLPQIHSLLLSIFVKLRLIAGPRQVGLDLDTKDKSESIVDAHRSEGSS